MRTYPYRVAGAETLIYYIEHADDITAFTQWLDYTPGILAVDTETTSLRVFSSGFHCRLVQIGDADTAWVIPAQQHGRALTELFAQMLRAGRQFVAHNAPFDLLVLDHEGIAPLEQMAPVTYDTYILGHMLDPRLENDGGTGLGLKPMSTVYVDPNAADTAKGLYSVFHKEYRATKSTGWALIDIDHPLYVTYAGLDVIYASRLLNAIGPVVRAMGMTDLGVFEHRVQHLTTRLQKRGARVDVPYTEGLAADLAAEADRHERRAFGYGITSVNAPKQVAAALEGMGEEWTATTDSGAPSVKKEVLAVMADIDVRSWERLEIRDPNPLADAIIRAKRAGKWGAAYAQPFLTDRDEADRIHPRINSLAARTARMSISEPPLQQLPSSDWRIRRAIIADDGYTVMAADYKSMELRVLAALADVAEMKKAIAEGRDLHDYTAELLYGPGFLKPQRRLAKGVGLGKVFGGGAKGLSEQIGAPLAQVKVAVDRYDAVYPEVRAYGNHLQRLARYGGNEVVTPIGRHLPLDRDRAYAATNYVVQSTARDLIAKAMVDIDDAGLFDYLLLPVHDELVCQAPTADAADIIAEIGKHMQREFMGVPIDVDTEVYGPSWGHGYSIPEGSPWR